MSITITFATQYKHEPSQANPTGTQFDVTRTMTIDENGHKVLKTTGKTNRYEKVQSYKDETEIANILAKATMDPSILNQRIGEYFDATNMPSTLAEAQNKILEIKEEFYKLPVDVRKEFDNSLEKYVQKYGTEFWGKAVGLIKDKVVEKEEADPTEEKTEGGKQ